MEFLLHTPCDGDRPDLLAYHYYGDASLMGHILRANPHLMGQDIKAGGPTIKIPVIDPPPAPPGVGLPPWRC
jgi:phage tail protein X